MDTKACSLAAVVETKKVQPVQKETESQALIIGCGGAGLPGWHTIWIVREAFERRHVGRGHAVR
jgi:hypothetical protein